MHTTAPVADRAPADLTARARIRDAAIIRFADAGFETPFRTIAALAGVSPALITHHFGSKAALRAECDAEVLRRYHALKTSGDRRRRARTCSRSSRVPGAAAIVLVYMLRAIHAGGKAAETFMDGLVDHVRGHHGRERRDGLIRPSRDEEARARYLTYQTMGAMLIEFLMAPGLTPDEFVATVKRANARPSSRPSS